MAQVKNVIVTFQFDPETELVTNVLCSIDGVEKKKRVTKKKDDVIEEMAKEPLLTREETKLVLNNKLVADMDIQYEDRIIIRWETVGKTLFPIIGKDLAFDQEGSGNKVTKTNTVAFKGKQNVVLAEFGEVFTIEPYINSKYPEGVWKLISTTSPTTTKTLKETIKAVERVNPDLIVTGDETTEIDELQFKL